MQNLHEISKLVKNLHSEIEVETFFKELLTESEIETLSKRWCILNKLNLGFTQREIAKGAKILKNKDSVLAKYLTTKKK